MVLIYGMLAGFFSLFISYTLQPGEIFFGWSYFLAKWRLKRMGWWEQYKAMTGERKEKRKIGYYAAEDYFTWEKALGMCVICSGFWICLISGIFYTFKPVPLIEIVLIGHVTIRTLKKFYD